MPPSTTIARQSPIIGITPDVMADGPPRYQTGVQYAGMIAKAGGVPIILPCLPERVNQYLSLCDGFVFTGGDDPIMTDPRLGGLPMHPKAKPIDSRRQDFELTLLDALTDHAIEKPVLGVCLGMQMMGLHAGGALNQFLEDDLATADQHWNRCTHEISGELVPSGGRVMSHHRQALTDAGRLRVVARAPDGVIEAVRSEDRPFYLGVQWHPERTDDEALGLDIFRQLVDAAKQTLSVR
jgi:putative glutamine amidotransferase